MEPLILPRGYGFRSPMKGEIAARGILDALVIYEAPRRRGRAKYVIGADVSDGLGQDRSVAEVVRLGTIEEPAEQVAEYASDQMLPAGFAYVLQTLGQYYRSADDGVEACVAIETNSHGLTTQDTLQLHLGYGHFYIWEVLDAADPGKRQTTKVGWYTTPRSRGPLLAKLRDAICTYDPITGLPDLVTHSPFLHEEFQDFQTDGALWEAAAARGARDDRVMALAIANYVAHRLQGGESEPLEDRRRRRSEQVALLARASEDAVTRPDYRNQPFTAEETMLLEGTGLEDHPEELDAAVYDGDVIW